MTTKQTYLLTSMLYTSYKEKFANLRHRKRLKRQTDITRQESGLPILIAERNASDRNGWRRRNDRGVRGQLT